ncbi:PA14 domain-containing protein [Verrucomicrobiales bacterium]|nr:PA14 domain-containing protein [Verrucomicrobiales bacterium]
MDRKITIALAALFAVFHLAHAEPPEWSGNPDKEITIKTLPGMMRYDTPEIVVEPGAKVKITIENPDDLEHNFVLLDQDKDDKDGQKFGELSFQLGAKGIEMNWVPDSPRVLAKTGMIGLKASTEVYFIAPEKVGMYPYICTVPGHSLLMRGKMKVAKDNFIVRDVTWKLFDAKGKKISKLADFDGMEPIKTGKAKNNLISLQPANQNKLRNNYALIFEGKFTAPKTEVYEFLLNSDDGSRLAVNGEEFINNDGIHPPKTVSHKEELEKGEHTFRLGFFDGGGGAKLSLVAKTKFLGSIPFSADQNAKNPKKKTQAPILLTAANPGEAIVHRTFVGGAKPRGIGVGYPGGINLVWDADVLNLAFVYRGGFMDVGGHWNGRGSGSKIAGFDSENLSHGLPMQELESLDEPWEPFYDKTIKYERDKENPEKEITYTDRHPDYQFRGYQLDKKRFPTFMYDYKNLKVTDRFDPTEIDGAEALIRKIKVEGDAGENIWMRVLNHGSDEIENGWIKTAQKVWIKIEGVEPTTRTASGMKETIVPIKGGEEITVTYKYTKAIGGKVKK